MKKSSIRLDFRKAIEEGLIEDNIRHDLSAATRTGNYLWIAGDENLSVQRLEKTAEDCWGNAQTFLLSDFIELISEEDEADIEGMDFDGHYLWITGSHSYKRSNIKPDAKKPKKEIKKLTKVSMDPNRILLMRIPCQPNAKGEWELLKECPDPEHEGQVLTASKLKHGKKKSHLTKTLQHDPHLRKFMKIPGKDNGFDIEGLAAFRECLFLGLRGPVLRGWAIILQVQIKQTKKGLLKLAKMNQKGERYKKYFLDLNGMGIRELSAYENDLLILAGPTMDLDGTMSVYRWKNILGDHEDALINQQEIEEILTLPHKSHVHGIDKAEGMVMLEDHSLLLVFDSPSKTRIENEHVVKADVYQLAEGK